MDLFQELKVWLKGRNPLWGLDFDGTLVELQSDPERVALNPHRTEVVKKFADRFDTAIISGRALTDIMRHVKFMGTHFIGTHGSQLLKRDGSLWNWHSLSWDTWRQAKLHQLQELIQVHGGWIEDKGLGLTIHYRAAKDEEWWSKSAESRLKEFLEPVASVLEGNMCWNVIPAGAPNKGLTTARLCRELGHDSIFFIGDEATDETIFELSEIPVFGIKVGDGPTSAKARLKNPTEVIELLALITQKL